MISSSTVLVLGAGSSVHMGYPIGGDLVNALCRLRGSSVLEELPNDWSAAQAEDLLTRLCRSAHYSIDAFLETVPEEVDLGKYLLARELKQKEDVDRLFPPHDSGWYQYLFNALLDDKGEPAFSESQLGVITFNYDRSLEAYLLEALVARFRMSNEEAAATLEGVPIIHVHGVLGTYPETAYRSDVTGDELLKISTDIQIIHEVEDNDVGFCNAAFEDGHDLLLDAQRTFFLGFGFHLDNVRRFRFFESDSVANLDLLGTANRMGAMRKASMLRRLEPYGFADRHFDGNTCDNFFKNSVELF